MNRITVGKIDVFSVFLAWTLLIVFFISLAYAKLFASQDKSAFYLVYILGGFTFSAGAHIVLAFFNRCPHCNRCLTVQGLAQPHPNSTGGWSGVVWRWYSGSVVCIHCGNHVDTDVL